MVSPCDSRHLSSVPSIPLFIYVLCAYVVETLLRLKDSA